MAPKLRRPEVDASIHICSRSLIGTQSVAVQVGNRAPHQLRREKSPETIQVWTDELELDILTGLNVDPKRYSILIHAHTPADQPCPESQGISSLKEVAGLSETITGPYEVHFVLRRGVKSPTVADLRAWQARWAIVFADPPPPPQKNHFALCNSRAHIASLAVEKLVLPPPGNVELTDRYALRLISSTDLVNHNLGAALRLDLKGREVKFHLGSEVCDSSRSIEELPETTLAATDVVKLHVFRH
jgi:hypothetical protein